MEAPYCAFAGSLSNLPGRLDGLLHRYGYMLPKGAEWEIPLIKCDLKEIIAILKGHHDLEFEDHTATMMVKCWMKEVRELWYDMEDCINQYEHAAASSRSGVPACRNFHPRRKITRRKSNPSWLPEKLKQRLWMANKIREFSARVQDALHRHATYNLGSIGATVSTARSDISSLSWRPTPFEDNVRHVIIRAAMSKLEEWLTTVCDGGERELKVVSIVGFGGAGKTTLAHELYHKLGRQFECHAFVRTSQKPDVRRLLISMLSQLCPHEPPGNWKVHTILSSIRTHLQDKRYLIIIDDLWATSTWDVIKCALPNGNRCSRIVTTTEIEDLALQSCGYDSKYIFKIKPLGEDDSSKLFFSTVFGPHNNCPPELSEVAYDIIRKCGGLPLAIVTIAGLLACHLGKQEQWSFVNKSLGYSLMTDPTLEAMKQVLSLSYNNLPRHLKACMLYLTIYQEDYIIWKDDLVNQWIAEGFVCATEEQDEEEISRSYFDELVNRGMIQPVHIDDNDEVMSCIVHHVVLNLITYKSIEENFVIAIDHSQTTIRLADKVRRLSIYFGNAEDATPPTNMRLSQVRTLSFFGVFKCMPSIVEFRLLQVVILHFWGDEDTISFDLTRISELFRLRYLKVTSNVTLELQIQMRGLQYLETLKIDARLSAVPSDIAHLPGLLHLSLPAETNLPNGICHMASLQTLGYFDLSSNSMENVQSLDELTNLRNLQLTCSNIQHDNLENKIQFLSSILGKLSNLKSMTVEPTVPDYMDDAAGAPNMSTYCPCISCDSWNSSVSSPLTLLQRLAISPRICIFSCLPKIIGQLNKLSILKIGVKDLASNDVNVLRGLSVLTVLYLYVHTQPAERIVFDKVGFSTLKYFTFRCCLPLLKFEADAMPNLQKLKLGFDTREVYRSGNMPMPIGMEHLSGLKDISAQIGVAGSADAFSRKSTESAWCEAIRMHSRCPSINIQCVNWMFDVKGLKSGTPREGEQLETIKKDLQHGIPQNDSQKDANKYMHKRRTMVSPSVMKQVRVLDDGFSWRKYGQKHNPGAKHPRSYYRCTHQTMMGCQAKKKVQINDEDPLLFDVSYQGVHTCHQSSTVISNIERTEHQIMWHSISTLHSPQSITSSSTATYASTSDGVDMDCFDKQTSSLLSDLDFLDFEEPQSETDAQPPGT